MGEAGGRYMGPGPPTPGGPPPPPARSPRATGDMGVDAGDTKARAGAWRGGVDPPLGSPRWEGKDHVEERPEGGADRGPGPEAAATLRNPTTEVDVCPALDAPDPRPTSVSITGEGPRAGESSVRSEQMSWGGGGTRGVRMCV